MLRSFIGEILSRARPLAAPPGAVEQPAFVRCLPEAHAIRRSSTRGTPYSVGPEGRRSPGVSAQRSACRYGSQAHTLRCRPSAGTRRSAYSSRRPGTCRAPAHDRHGPRCGCAGSPPSRAAWSRPARRAGRTHRAAPARSPVDSNPSRLIRDVALASLRGLPASNLVSMYLGADSSYRVLDALSARGARTLKRLTRRRWRGTAARTRTGGFVALDGGSRASPCRMLSAPALPKGA